jgi:Fe2+ or Zn2+ uptake regulation protein
MNNPHQNARLTRHSREQIVARVVAGQTTAAVAAVRRNLVWMEDEGSIREVTGQGRFRMWRVSMPRSFPPSDAD